MFNRTNDWSVSRQCVVDVRVVAFLSGDKE